MYSENHNMSDLPEWLAKYLKANLLHDEVEHHNGGTTEHWDTLFSRLANLSELDITVRTNEIKRLLQDSGVTHSAYATTKWQLDPLPLMLSSVDWLRIEAGIKQRVGLLDHIKSDLYGSQLLLMNGQISSNLLHQNANYMRECFDLPAQTSGLFITAFDIYRDENGQFNVLADHCQAPKGLGLLLENRIIARRVMSDEFAECNVQRVAHFFELIQQNINNSTSNMRDPRVVIWSQGVNDPNYSEHAFLATYLGYTLVQSADLTVRKGKVWLKSLAGLRKVDVILRWLPDRCIDSLEQTEYSLHGIAGILQAIREGAVKVFNPMGCGVLEAPAIKQNLSVLAEQLLGEPLILSEPAVFNASYATQLDWRNHQLLSYSDSEFCADGAIDGELIQQKLETAPDAYYFRQKPCLSTAPFWSGNKLIAKPVLFRFFALSTPNGVQVLPSALCFEQDNKLSHTGWIKDTWVNSQQIQAPVSTSSPTRSMMDLALLEGIIPSRTAENLFWLGRYLERSENTVRFLRVYIDRYTELAVYPDEKNRKIVARLMAAIKTESIIYPYNDIVPDADKLDPLKCKKVAYDLFANENIAGSVLTCLNFAVNAALQVKDLLSSDSWRIVDDIEEQIAELKQASISISTRDMQSLLDKIMGYIMAFNGSIADSMSNSNGWFMLDMGRRIERSIQITSFANSLLSVELDEIEQIGLLETVLLCQVSLITHKRRYRMYQSIATGLELLLLDAEYPRSLLFQLELLHSLCGKLPSKRKPGLISAHEKALLQSKTSCYLTERDSLVVADKATRENLVEFLRLIRFNLDTFCDLLLLQYFTHTQTAKKLTWSDIDQDSK
ncbi:circularly permuted type 2 ATP-grasp protein [Algibacillus agarilyticus]|uniref:circularly permuted type 2 ATP-grasp protein n=1 Tax=Algibacillus agarilyticus TaxID=2234133 RepID=UPI000DCFF940|nr:circularly permuted type 2 ATP-grasp protein [Algibacillus agarilyticus]